MNLNHAPSTATVTESVLLARFNSELALQGDHRRLAANRSTKLGDFVLHGGASPRLWLRSNEVEYLARRRGLLAADEAVTFDHGLPMRERAYAPT
jgi:hypothetical protein